MSNAELISTHVAGNGKVDGGRLLRGERIAASTPIVKTSTGWSIQSQSRSGVYYQLTVDENGPHCNCPDPMRVCKHVVALQAVLERDGKAKNASPFTFGPVVPDAVHHPPQAQQDRKNAAPPAKGARKKRRRDWEGYNLAQNNEKPELQQLLHALCALVPEPTHHGKGRRPVSVRDMVFAEIFREYTGLSSRRFKSAVIELAKEGFISQPFSHNIGTRFLNQPETTDLLRSLITESARPLQSIERTFAPDSSGFSTTSYGRWQEEKHGRGNTGATYVKTHILVGVRTHIITAATASVQPVGDITQLPTLLNETRGAQFTVDELTADAAYLSEPTLEWLYTLGIDAWIPFRKNSKFHYDNSLWDRHLAVFLLNQDLFAEHYHQRSQVESTFANIKDKYRASVRGKTPTSQANNVLCKLLANNLYVLIRSIYELGLKPEFAQIGNVQNPAPTTPRLPSF